jgi:hypothetical protein
MYRTKQVFIFGKAEIYFLNIRIALFLKVAVPCSFLFVFVSRVDTDKISAS